MAPPRLTIDVLTLFPGMFSGYFEESIMKRAREKGLLRLSIHNLREWSRDKHKKVDDKPFGGGAGMVMTAPVVFEAVESLRKRGSRIILLSPQGEVFDDAMAKEFSRARRLLLICGHYEGIDERVRELLPIREISIGDFVVSNGAPAAMLVIDATVRLVPGVLGDEQSAREDSFYNGILDYPHYTRPRSFKGRDVPRVLISGDHEKVRRWRRREALRRTMERRPDLIAGSMLSKEDMELMREIEKADKKD